MIGGFGVDDRQPVNYHLVIRSLAFRLGPRQQGFETAQLNRSPFSG